MLSALDVIWIHDSLIRPPGPKMVVCVAPEAGYFFRINTRATWQNPVFLAKVSNFWLDHDSYLECGQPLMLDDYVVESSLKYRGIVGVLDQSLINSILSAMANDDKVSEEDFEIVSNVLRPLARGP